MESKEKVVVLGASAKEERYSFKAVENLTEKGHEALPVHPSGKPVAGKNTFSSLPQVGKAYPDGIDTITVYVNPKLSSSLSQEMLDLTPKRVIFNPGAENPELEKKLREKGIETLQACTLVLLRTNQF